MDYTFIYYVERDPTSDSASPDCYVVFGLTDAALRSLSLEGNNTDAAAGPWDKPLDLILAIGIAQHGHCHRPGK